MATTRLLYEPRESPCALFSLKLFIYADLLFGLCLRAAAFNSIWIRRVQSFMYTRIHTHNIYVHFVYLLTVNHVFVARIYTRGLRPKHRAIMYTYMLTKTTPRRTSRENRKSFSLIKPSVYLCINSWVARKFMYEKLHYAAGDGDVRCGFYKINQRVYTKMNFSVAYTRMLYTNT